jgi:putative acetyltransferase
MTIRDERTGDEHEVEQIIAAAFANHPHSDQREGWIVKRLRAGKALTLSRVADENGWLAGHITFSQPADGDRIGLCQSVYDGCQSLLG